MVASRQLHFIYESFFLQLLFWHHPRKSLQHKGSGLVFGYVFWNASLLMSFVHARRLHETSSHSFIWLVSRVEAGNFQWRYSWKANNSGRIQESPNPAFWKYQTRRHRRAIQIWPVMGCRQVWRVRQKVKRSMPSKTHVEKPTKLGLLKTAVSYSFSDRPLANYVHYATHQQ